MEETSDESDKTMVVIKDSLNEMFVVRLGLVFGIRDWLMVDVSWVSFEKSF